MFRWQILRNIRIVAQKRDFGVAHGSQVQQLQAIMTLGWSALLLGETVTLTMALSAIGIVLCVLWALSNVNKVKSS